MFKKKNSLTILIFSFIVLSIGLVSADYSQWDSSVFEDDLLGWYRFDNVTSIGDNDVTALDYSGNNNNGTYEVGAGINLSGLVGAGYSGGILGGADRVSVSGIEEIFFDDFTVIGWFNSRLWNSDTATTDNIIGTQNGVSGSNIGWKLLDSDANETGISVQANNGSNFNNIATPNNFTEDTWFYFAITYNGTRVHFYINETLQGTSSTIPDGLNNSNPFEIGNAQASTSRAFNGTMDEVMVFNRTLDITNITNIYLQQRDNCIFDYNNMSITEDTTFCHGGEYNRTSDFQRYVNGNATIPYNISIQSLTNALVYFDNNSILGSTNIASNDGGLNTTVLPGNSTFILNDFNLTEGITRQNSPLWFSSVSINEKRIASNLTDTINATFIFGVREQPTSILYVSDSGIFNYTLLPVNWTFNNANLSIAVTLEGIEQATGSNNLTITYISSGRDACNDLVLQFGTYPALIGLVGVVILLGAVVMLLITGFLTLKSSEFERGFVFTAILIVISVAVLVVVAIVIFGSICILL